MSIAKLTDRSKNIFQQIVETYLDTGDPVGSRTISRADGINVSAATIRNVMSDLEEAGLISAPHTSAGRVPTDLGLRLFVDGMMEVGNLTKSEREAIKGQCISSGKRFEKYFVGCDKGTVRAFAVRLACDGAASGSKSTPYRICAFVTISSACGYGVGRRHCGKPPD